MSDTIRSGWQSPSSSEDEPDALMDNPKLHKEYRNDEFRECKKQKAKRVLRAPIGGIEPPAAV